MKKFIKIFLLSLLSLFVILLLTSGIAMWILLSPGKLTPVVRKQSDKHIPYPTQIGTVDLTLFSTFPQVGIRLNQLSIISDAEGAVSDTLLSMNEVTGIINARKYLRDKELIINEIILSDGSVNIFTDSQGASNYQLFLTESSTEEETEEEGFSFINLENIELRNMNLTYNDMVANLSAAVNDLTASLSGNLRQDEIEVNLNIEKGGISFSNKGEKYLENAKIKLHIPAKVQLARQKIDLSEAFLSVNDLGINMKGSIVNDPQNGDISTDISYELKNWKIEDALAIVPANYISQTGIQSLSGILSSEGSVKGTLNDSLLPVMDIGIRIENSHLGYADLPFPLDKINGDMHFFGDMNNKGSSWIQLNNFSAHTPSSNFKTSGRINHIFSDMHFDLISNVNAVLEEFMVFIPDTMNMDMKGRINMEMKTDFFMSHIEKMELDKVKMTGTASLIGFDVKYDSLSMLTNYSRLSFSLPNARPYKNKSSFVSARIQSDRLDASMIESFNTSLDNSNIYLEMSDPRDTTRIPDIFCVYKSDTLRASMDTINVSMVKPYGNISLYPSEKSPGLPALDLAYSTFDLRAQAGKESLSIGDIMLNTQIVNDTTQQDVFLQWLAHGNLDMKDGKINMSTLTDPVEISAIKMDFDPETFNIHESLFRIDRSDFGLKGTANNILSYFRGDSILRADFSFSSESTDLNKLMYLTSGMGSEEKPKQPPPEETEEESFSGPYMVPQGMDFILRARIDNLIQGMDTATNIAGDVRIKDGILVLDDLNFTTPAAEMQLTAMYRTPRKNHIYLGMDYHMLDVEISRLLEMIPDIDTLMPMLRSFAGSGEFHLAVETYVDSAYEIKTSTLRGAASIQGEDLVLMDGETFGEIAKTLRFSRKAENRVDSLSAEFTIFREEIDIYPFLIVMDRYKAIVGGRHNFDMSFNYHISLIDSPLPVRLGVDIKGNADELQYRPTNAKYSELYRPIKRNVVENRQLELRKMIREALIQNVENEDEGEGEGGEQ